ncbi:MAG: hypothetical protein KAY37_12225 [Phycisphaerae bacterium]|nr:hypothetical protein [Phycisphaerae bacterium]
MPRFSSLTRVNARCINAGRKGVISRVYGPPRASWKH